MIIPGPLEKDFDVLLSKLKLVEEIASIFSIDVADGTLTEGKSFVDYSRISEIKTDLELELHLMLLDPVSFLEGTDVSNVDRVCAQVEGEGIQSFVDMVSESDLMLGLSISPGSDIATLDRFVAEIDYVQFMTVKPGAQGRPFESSVLESIRDFRKNYPDIRIQTDGSMNPDTIPQVKKLGVRDQVVGSYLYSGDSVSKRFLELSQL